MATETAPAHNVRIRHDVYECLVREAEDRDQTITSLINNILADRVNLETAPPQRARSSTLRAARRMVG